MSELGRTYYVANMTCDFWYALFQIGHIL